MVGTVDGMIQMFEKLGLPAAVIAILAFLIWRMIQAYREDSKRKAEHESRLLDLISATTTQVGLLRQTLEKQNAQDAQDAQNSAKAIEDNTAAIAANTSAVLSMQKAFAADLAATLERANESHRANADRVIARIETAQADITDTVELKAGELAGQITTLTDATAASARADSDRLRAVEGQLAALPAALAGALAKEFAPVVNEWKAFRTDIEYMLGDQFKEGLRAALNEHQANLERALTQAAQSTITTVTAEVRKLATSIAAPETVASDPLAAPTKHATGTLPAVPSDAQEAKT